MEVGTKPSPAASPWLGFSHTLTTVPGDVPLVAHPRSWNRGDGATPTHATLAPTAQTPEHPELERLTSLRDRPLCPRVPGSPSARGALWLPTHVALSSPALQSPIWGKDVWSRHQPSHGLALAPFSLEGSLFPGGAWIVLSPGGTGQEGRPGLPRRPCLVTMSCGPAGGGGHWGLLAAGSPTPCLTGPE